MNLKDVEHILEQIVGVQVEKLDPIAAETELKGCEAVLRRETGLRRVEPGEPYPIMRYELLQARELIEQAITKLSAGGVAEAMQQAKEALAKVKAR